MVETVHRRLDRVDDLFQQRRKFIAALDQLGRREPLLERLASLGEAQAAHALVGRGDEHPAKAGGHPRPVARPPLAAVHPVRSPHTPPPPPTVTKARLPRKATLVPPVRHPPPPPPSPPRPFPPH